MAQTKNLKITKLEGSDVVDYEYFNQIFEKIDSALADYVVEASGSNSGVASWWYRKWNSGRAECGIDNKLLSGNYKMETWGSMYASPSISFGNYPFTFITSSRPYANVTFNYSGNGGMCSYVAQYSQGGSVTSPSFRIIDPLLNTTLSNPQCGIYCCGRWK